jgi:hypothetical protein
VAHAAAREHRHLQARRAEAPRGAARACGRRWGRGRGRAATPHRSAVGAVAQASAQVGWHCVAEVRRILRRRFDAWSACAGVITLRAPCSLKRLTTAPYSFSVPTGAPPFRRPPGGGAVPGRNRWAVDRRRAP